ncbi:MAG: hypothetical protein ACYCZW_01945 [Minisyncoccota bacterium]
MDNLSYEIKKAFNELPLEIRELIKHSSWESKLREISLKYSLTENQTDTLSFEVLLVLLAISSEEDLSENIKTELGVSGILAEQLTEEINQRIFSWIEKQYSEKENKHINSLDIPPVNLPGEVVEDIPESMTEYTEKNNEIIEEKYIAPENTNDTIENLQTPEPVLLRDEVTDFFAPTQTVQEKPQINIPSLETQTVPENLVPPIKQTAPSFISNKLTQSTNPQINTNQQIPKKYNVDPYREPIE